jgi:hypothetical protein
VDAQVAELAGAQGGVVGREQLIALGLSRTAIARRIEAGRLHGVHRGVYAVGHCVLGRSGREWAAVLALGAGAVLSHRSVGARLAIVTWNGRPEVTVPTGRRGRAGITVHTARSLNPEDVTLGDDGLPQTTWARAVIDLAELFDVHAITRILERSAIERHYDGLTLAPAMTRAHGRHGLPTLVAALNRGHHLNPQRTRSPQEERYLRELREGGTDARVNHWMWVTDRFIEADVWFPERRVIVELDSRWHDTAGARERDAARDQACRAAGIEVRRLRPYASAPSSRSTRRRIASDEAYVESIP